MEEAVLKVIANITKNNNKACYQSVLTFINQGNEKIKMDELKIILQDLLDSNKICNIGKKRKGCESFRLVIQQQQNVDRSKEVGHLEKTVISDELESFIDDNCYKVLINRIKDEVKLAVKDEFALLNRKSNVNELSDKPDVNDFTETLECPENANDQLLNTLRSEILFLREELLSKDKIIGMILDERNSINIKEKKVESNKSVCVDNSSYNIIQAQDNVNECFHTEKKCTDDNKKTRTNRSTIILGDSLLKDIEAHKFKEGLGNTERVYVKSFSGTNTVGMKSYVIPSKEFENDLVILHSGTNDLHGKNSTEDIATDIIQLAKEMKTEKNEVMVSGIIPRNDKYNDKGMDVNKLLMSFCLTCKFHFIDNSNINKETHLNMSGLHLNAKGQYVLGTNLLNSIKL